MASKNLAAPLLRAVTTRNYGSAAPKTVACSAAPLQVSKTSKRTTVVTSDCTNNGIAKVAVAIKAGSRFESADNLGVSHVLRSAAGLATEEMSHFKVQKSLQAIGANLTATSDRETIIYTLDAREGDLPKALEVLKAVVASQIFKPWELSDNIAKIKEELARVPAPAKVLDYVHQAAFRTGLGNSIFAKEFDLKSLNSEAVQHFYSNNFLANRIAVSGVGVDHGTLADFADELQLDSGEKEAGKSQYYGGDSRHSSDSKVVYTAIAGEGRGFNKKDVFSYAALRFALGGKPAVSYGNPSGPLGAALANVKGSSSQAFSIAHSDAGLFGILVASDPSCTRDAVKAAVETLKKGVKDEDIARGKAMLKASVLYGSESPENLSHDLAIQALFLGAAKAPCDISKSIDEVTPASVKEAHGKLMCSKLSLASVGRIAEVPYLDEL